MNLHQTYTNLIFKVFNICKDEFARAETFSTNFHFTNPRGLNCITRKVKRPRKLESLLSLTSKVAEGLWKPSTDMENRTHGESTGSSVLIWRT